MDKLLCVGISNELTQEVAYEDTAASYESGLVEVFATPAMIKLMEKTCMLSVAEYLPEGQTTVGTIVNIKHVKATLKGKRVNCISNLTEIDRRRLVFEVEARDENGVIGLGVHERFIIDMDKFMKELQ